MSRLVLAGSIRRVVVSQIGALVGLAGLAFVIWTLFDDRQAIVDALGSMRRGLLAPIVISGVGGMLAIAFAWNRSLRALGAPRPIGDTFYRYFMGELGKYVPGGVWALVGRGELLQRVGVERRIAYTSIALSLVTTYGAALLTAAVAFVLGGGSRHLAYWWLIPIGCVIGIAALHPAVLRRTVGLMGRLMRRDLVVRIPTWGESIGLVMWNIPAWVLIGGGTWLIAVSLDPGNPGLANLIFATSVAWFVGFLAVPVPGGIGVREAVFLAAATSLSSAGVAAAVAVAARLLFVVVDAGTAVVCAAAYRRSVRNETST